MARTAQARLEIGSNKPFLRDMLTVSMTSSAEARLPSFPIGWLATCDACAPDYAAKEVLVESLPEIDLVPFAMSGSPQETSPHTRAWGAVSPQVS